MSTNAVLVIGSLAYDYIMRFNGLFSDRILEDQLNHLSLSFLVDSLDKVNGGTAGNIAYSLKLLDGNPLIFCPAGNDFEQYQSFFKQHQISTKYIPKYKEVNTSSYFVVTDKKQNQIGSFFTGALKFAKNHSIKSITEKISYAIIAPTDPEAMKIGVKECKELKIPFIYDPAFQVANFSAAELLEGIKSCEFLIGNEYEIELIKNKLDLDHEELLSQSRAVITTMGAKGSLIETRLKQIHVKPAKVKKALDPTGAGDAFRSGFIKGLLNNYPLDICGQIGSVAAAFVVEQKGTQKHKYTKGDFEKRYLDNYLAQIKI